MKRDMDGKINNTGVEKQPRLVRATLVLAVLFFLEVFLFTAAYHHLNLSIQNERIDSIEQMLSLIHI